MQISFVIITHNRRDALWTTLAQLPGRVGLPPGAWEVVVVDNASADGTADAILGHHPGVQLVQQSENNPCTARNAGVAAARAPIVCFLDDDSCPRQGSIQAALAVFDASPTTAMLGGPVHLPGDGQDGCALPLVAPCCGMLVRRAAFQAVEGFDPWYHMAAEEYELAFRLVQAGYRLQREDTVVFDHAKTPGARSPDRILTQDLRNNAWLALRYFSEAQHDLLFEHWVNRYTALMAHAGIKDRAAAAVQEARQRIADMPGLSPYEDPDHKLSERQFEILFGLKHQQERIAAFAKTHQPQRIGIAGYTKTLPITERACRAAGLKTLAIIDDHPAYHGMHLQGVAVLPTEKAQALGLDALILSDINPGRVQQAAEQLQHQFKRPVLSLL